MHTPANLQMRVEYPRVPLQRARGGEIDSQVRRIYYWQRRSGGRMSYCESKKQETPAQ